MERTSYVCRECQTTVSPASYRATCPECSGELRPSSVTGRRRAGD
ncbi:MULTISPECIES: rubrerythrin-like domain-containing protein [Haloferax]|uniref:Rubrerythrin-like domain-containing protein n=2 Tax=Haloferax TaxID=2251 RepID=A0A6G1Z3W9_9EURY|nr:rubrerythrin-like domain-containing protein [Haloferax sp. CBA1149]MRW81004.1 rubrerythrin-like domain-containing protein [Haloferax marinisediminis]